MIKKESKIINKEYKNYKKYEKWVRPAPLLSSVCWLNEIALSRHYYIKVTTLTPWSARQDSTRGRERVARAHSSDSHSTLNSILWSCRLGEGESATRTRRIAQSQSCETSTRVNEVVCTPDNIQINDHFTILVTYCKYDLYIYCLL